MRKWSWYPHEAVAPSVGQGKFKKKLLNETLLNGHYRVNIWRWVGTRGSPESRGRLCVAAGLCHQPIVPHTGSVPPLLRKCYHGWVESLAGQIRDLCQLPRFASATRWKVNFETILLVLSLIDQEWHDPVIFGPHLCIKRNAVLQHRGCLLVPNKHQPLISDYICKSSW